MSGAVPYGASKPVSRVLSFKTAIYLGASLPPRSSHLLNTAGPAWCVPTVLLRIEFTAMDCSQPSGRLLPLPFHPYLVGADSSRAPRRKRHGSFLSPRVSPHEGARRFLSVALFLGSPPAGVTRYPCPAEPGLSSRAGLSPRPHGCPAYLPSYDTGISPLCQMILTGIPLPALKFAPGCGIISQLS